jgi:hypothetical protein
MRVPDFTAELILGIITVATGGSLVQLAIFLMRRKGELKALDTTATVPLIEQQGAFVDRVAAANELLTKQLKESDERQKAELKEFTAQLERSSEERDRLANDVARMRTELGIRGRQIETLESQLQGLYRSQRSQEN